MSGDRRVLVVGGGISGLAAGLRLAESPGVNVELWEAGSRLGGKIATSPFAGLEHVDEGADAFLTRVPHAVQLAAAVGLGDELTSPTGASAMVWHDGLHALPEGIVLGVPASVRPFVTSRLISWRGKLRAAIEPLLPRTDPHDNLGRLVRARFGDEVHERLVDALVGSIYAADTDRWSLAAVPQLSQLATRHRSLLLGARSARNRSAGPAAGPIFATPRRGMAALVDATADRLKAAGGVVDLDRPATPIAADGGGWRVNDQRFDAIVLASPAAATAGLVGSIDADAAGLLRSFEHADVILVRLLLDNTHVPPRLHANRSGYLVAKPRQRLVTAVSFGSQKWSHWQPPGGGHVLRVSLGRDGLPVLHLDHDAVVAAVIDDLRVHLGGEITPSELSITRWPAAFPQYRPHHSQRVDEVERRLPPTIALAGASYRGIGIPACIADGQRAATAVLAALEA